MLIAESDPLVVALWVLVFLGTPFAALIGGLFLAGDPHRRTAGRLTGLVLIAIAALDFVAAARGGDGDLIRLCFALTLLLLGLGFLLRGQKRPTSDDAASSSL